MSKLRDRLLKAGSIKNSFILSKSPYFNARDVTPTALPILNVAFSGSLKGGLVSGLTVFAGPSKCFKSMLGLYTMKAYLDANPDATVLFYDTEFGTNDAYLSAFGIDPDRLIHIVPEHIEAMKFDVHKRLSEVEQGEKVFVFIDSLSNAGAKKDFDDADKENHAKNMQRQGTNKDFLRLLSSHLNKLNIPAVCINHTYQTMELYSKTVVSGGTAVMYIANQVFIITKAQAKDGDEVVGNDFTIRIEKSRFINEQSKFSFRVIRGKGIQLYSGLFDLAMEAGIVNEVTKGYYSAPGYEKTRRKEIEQDKTLWEALIRDEDFDKFVREKYELSMGDVDE